MSVDIVNSLSGFSFRYMVKKPTVIISYVLLRIAFFLQCIFVGGGGKTCVIPMYL